MKQLETPVLFIVFNRFNTTQLVFKKIKQIRPTQLFIASDGPRKNNAEDEEKCLKVRNYITKNIDWSCEVKTLFQNENLGCGKSCSNAISWFFEHVEEGIILEDDCLPDLSFFQFCTEMLERYRDNKEIMIVSGFNNLGTIDSYKYDYLFSQYAGIWGWASWRRAWSHYNYELPEWNDAETQKSVLNSLKSKYVELDLKTNLDNFTGSNSNRPSWDYQWWFYRLLNKSFGIVPSKSLIQNIGFNEDATHTIDENNYANKILANELSFPLKHPKKISCNNKYEKKIIRINYYNSDYQRQTVFKLVKRFLKRIIKKL